MSRVMVLLAVLSWAVSARATDFIFPMQQVRTVSVYVPYPNSADPITHSGPVSGTWYDVLSLEAPVWADGGTAYTTAIQYSDMTPTGISIYGLADQWSDPFGAAGSLPLVQSGSHAWMRFAVPARVAYELTGDLSSEAGGRAQPNAFGDVAWELAGRVSIELRRVAGPDPFALDIESRVMNFDPGCCDPNCASPPCSSACYDFGCADPHVVANAPVSFAGELLPGVYELEVEAQTSFDILHFVNIDFAGAPFRVETTMVVTMSFAEPSPIEPCDADLDGDGDVDLNDFARMQTCFNGPA